MCLPVVPDDTISERSRTAVTINAIQVRMVTVTVPPGSVVITGTVVGHPWVRWVIILIFSGKWLTIMLKREGVTCSPWDIKSSKDQPVICRSKGFVTLKQAKFCKLGHFVSFGKNASITCSEGQLLNSHNFHEVLEQSCFAQETGFVGYDLSLLGFEDQLSPVKLSFLTYGVFLPLTRHTNG